MRDLLIIQPHSFVDIITNSSTELFVCGKDKTIDMVEDIIKQYCPMIGDCYEIRKPTKEELFRARNWDKIVSKKYGSYYREEHKYLPNELITEAKNLGLYRDSKENTKEGYFYTYGPGYSYKKELTEDSVIFEGTGDNDIPYEYFDIIQNILDASRHHLG